MMPKGSRGKGRPRPLRLSVRVIQVPAGISKAKVKKGLLLSIQSGNYTLPQGWIVQIGWQNNPKQEMRFDEWTNAMTDSTQGGRGWDKMVRAYLERQR